MRRRRLALSGRNYRSPDWLALSLALFVSTFCRHTCADDEFEQTRGLLAEYSAPGIKVHRVDPDLHFNWDKGTPDSQIPPAEFTVTWTGRFLHREDQPVSFHVYLSGDFQLSIADQEILHVSSPAEAWHSSRQVTIPPGIHDISATFTKTAPKARIGLFWSSPVFPIEPVTTYQFLCEEDLNDIRQLDKGRQLFENHRCNRCHARPGEEPSQPAPALWGVTQGLNPDWLIAKLKSSHSEAAESAMPHFGLTTEEATDIAVFLNRIGAPHELSSVPKVTGKRDQLPSGRTLLASIGCLACHQVGDLASSPTQQGPNLSRIGQKRSPEWLSTWLSQPEKLNPQHRMPVFKLTPTERALLVEELSSLRASDRQVSFSSVEGSGAQGDRGRSLIKSLRCANCHKIPAIEVDLKGLPTLAEPVKDWNSSCLAEMPNKATGRPVFPNADRDALRKYIESRTGHELHPLADFEQGKQILLQRQCFSCHERDGGTGVVPVAGQVAEHLKELSGQSEALIPPSLTSVGDKLLDDWLKRAIAGEQKEVRLPWLKVRMPQFNHSPEDREKILKYLVDHDRIPDRAPDLLQLKNLRVDERALLTGRSLVGAGGFSCIACHKTGDYEPRNVAFGTRGSDLMNLAQRMRPEFFLRWTRSPLRIVPGMEMPSYLRPARGLLDENLELQFTTLWAALSHPDFEAPTNPTQVEQFLVLHPGDRPRVVRDVFTIPGVDKTPSYKGIARAFAMGFDNGHSILFDLDSGQLRAWTYGDFARQRTEGKSWYWDMAGTLLNSSPDALGQLVLRTPRTPATATPDLADRSPVAHPESYHIGQDENGKDQLVLNYTLEIPDKSAGQKVQVTEYWSTISSDRSSGLKRELRLVGLPADLEPHLVRTRPEKLRFNALLRSFSLPRDFNPVKEKIETIAFENRDGYWSVVVAYDCDLPPYVPPTPSAQPVTANGLPPAPVIPLQNPLLNVPVTTLPGYVGRRLNVPVSTMPTSMAFDEQGNLYFTSLKGHVFKVIDNNGDGLEDRVTEFEEGLAAPFGVLPDGDGILVSHKPELLRLVDQDGDGRADARQVIADGWGYTDNYHDWTTGPVRDAAGRLYLALGSDYSQPDRPEGTGHWRGKVLRVNSDGSVDPIAHELRYPQGIAIDSRGRLFVTDQQGHGNPFNELNEIVEGRYYGVPARFDEQRPGEPTVATIKVPHPWTRSVNGVFFLPDDHPSPFAGHAIGCEYNGRFLVRYTCHDVDGALQGAVYPFTQTSWDKDDDTFVGPICGTVAPNGDILIGSIHDSGWLGGLNTGEIVRLSRTRQEMPNGIREVRAIAGTSAGQAGLEIEFIHPLSEERAKNVKLYSLTGYTRHWKGSYATEDSGRYEPEISQIEVSGDSRRVTLWCRDLKPDYVYELHCGELVQNGEPRLFPDFATYSMNRIPASK